MSDQPNSYEEEVNLEEMRRGLAVQAAVALGLTSVDDLLDAATKIEDYLGDGILTSKGFSDGHHTFGELYEYRMLYNAHAAQGWHAAGIPVVKSYKHSDGEPCFGGGWFIVSAELPTGQVSNHYRDEHWDLFNIPAVEIAPEYDGHTPEIAAKRLRDSIPLDEG